MTRYWNVLFLMVALALVACSGDDKAATTTQATTSATPTPAPVTTPSRAISMTVHPSSTLEFKPTTFTAKSTACGIPTAFSIQASETTDGKTTSVQFNASGPTPEIGKIYRDTDPTNDSKLSLSLLISYGGTTTGFPGGYDPTAVRATALRFDELTATEFTISFALLTYDGRLLSGKITGSFTVDSSCPDGKAEKRVGYDLYNQKKVCYVVPNAPVIAIACDPTYQQARFLSYCRSSGRQVVSCGPCEDYCSAPLY